VNKIVLAQAHLQSSKCAEINAKRTALSDRSAAGSLRISLNPPSVYESTPRKHYYCTELVASIYMAAGLIPALDSTINGNNNNNDDHHDDNDYDVATSSISAASFPSAVLDARFFWPNAFVPVTQTATKGSIVMQPCVVDSLLGAWSGARLSDEIAIDCRYRPLSRAANISL
jgi:hypothetical protein